MPEPDADERTSEYAAQTAAADLADFEAALEAKTIQPPDPEKAKQQHEQLRDFLETIVREDKAEEESVDWSEAQRRLKTPAPPIEEPAAPEEFASEFADYHRGAVSFRCGNFGKASESWKALLARPEAERKYRTTWALFMLGKAALETKDWNAANEWFVKTREAAAAGFVDSIGLASSSLGWQAYACEESKRYSEAARLFLDQLASGDTSAVLSLRHLMEKAFAEGADLDALVRDPILQRIGTAGAVSGMTPFSYLYSEENVDSDLATKWLAALEKAEIKNVRDADRVAWIAYARGHYQKAARWLGRADPDAPFSLWLKAKLTLREGKVDAAAKLLSRAFEKLRPTDALISRRLESSIEMPPEVTAGGDLGAIRLSRGEFVSAFRTFLDAGHFSDAYYIADAVLTIDELKRFLDEEIGAWEKARAKKKEAETESEPKEAPAADESPEYLKIGWEDSLFPPHDELRQILARRYVRAERFAEARPYLYEQAQEALDNYLAALERSKQSNVSKAERSAAFVEAAEIMREHGSLLVDFFDPLSIAGRSSGRLIDEGDYPVIAIKYGDRDKQVLPISKGEKDRLKKNTVADVRRRYSLYLAADLGWRAAALLPDNDEKTAQLLNRVGSWLKGRDDDAADRFYQAIERRCAKTELGKQAIKRRWFVPITDEGGTN